MTEMRGLATAAELDRMRAALVTARSNSDETRFINAEVGLRDALALAREVLARPYHGEVIDADEALAAEKAALMKDIGDVRGVLASNVRNLAATDPAAKDRSAAALLDLEEIKALAETDLEGATAKLRELKRSLADVGDKAAQIAAAAATAAREAAADAVRPRVEELRNPDHLAACVESMRRGDFAAARQAYRDLADNQAVLDVLGKDARAVLLRRLVDGALDGGPDGGRLDTALGEDPGFFAELLLSDAELRSRAAEPSRFAGTGPAMLGRHAPAVAAAMIRDHWTSMHPKIVGGEVYQWLNTTIDLATWNDPASGLAARMFNNLWCLGDQTERICDLVALGVDSSLPAGYGKDEGRGSREGIWSGFIQPLQHLLGHYVKRVADETDPGTGAVRDTASPKVKAAARILDELDRHLQTPILTSWDKVTGSGMVKAFVVKPGTIWGFEDVRLPYVQAARLTPDGQQPLRMMEIWEGVKGVLDEVGFEALLTNPDQTIAKCIEAGVTKIEDGIDSKNPEYAGRNKHEFVVAFKTQCTDYLRFLARRTPAAKLATADLNGKDPGKLMGALACKVGLWWAQKQGKPVYYCLDGIRMDQATSYKAYKNKGINDYWAAKDAGGVNVNKYLEVITFQEIREILKYWDDQGDRAGLKDTVVFVEKGKILAGAELDQKVAKWQADMTLSDTSAPDRRRAAKDTYKAAIDKLDPELWPSLTDREASQVVAKTELLKLAARSQSDLDLLGGYLENESEILYRLGILPKVLPYLYSATENTDLLRRPAQFFLELAVDTVCPALRGPLREAITRRFG
ncbi:MAG: hypothetical protein ACRDRH_26090 [Pseudonocardia sp.]